MHVVPIVLPAKPDYANLRSELFFSFLIYLSLPLTMQIFSLLSADLSVCEAYLLELNHLLQSMEVLHRTYSAPSIQALQVSTLSPIPYHAEQVCSM